jgi:hypothetical protein
VTTFVHAVTGPSVARLLLPYADAAGARALMLCAWQAFAALDVAMGDRPGVPLCEAAPQDAATLVDRIVTNGDEHVCCDDLRPSLLGHLLDCSRHDHVADRRSTSPSIRPKRSSLPRSPDGRSIAFSSTRSSRTGLIPVVKPTVWSTASSAATSG